MVLIYSPATFSSKKVLFARTISYFSFKTLLQLPFELGTAAIC